MDGSTKLFADVQSKNKKVYLETATDDPTNQPVQNPLTPKQILAAHIHIHLLFSPGQEETWTLLERKFPKATEQEFNAAIAYLEMVDVVSIDPHPHRLDEYLIKVDYSHLTDTPPPLPFPSFRFPALDTPLGTGTALSSSSVSENHTPARAVRFVQSSLHQHHENAAGRGVFGEGLQGEELVEGRWSHTPPRLRDALGEEDQLLDLEEEEEEGEGGGWEEAQGAAGEAVGVVGVGLDGAAGGLVGGKHQETKEVEVVQPPTVLVVGSS